MEENRELIVVIPAYEPPESFIAYVSELSKSAHRIIVVDDGSGEDFAKIFDKVGELDGVHVIGYAKNMGKGYALKRALSFCAESFRDEAIIVTADCDGQHTTNDIIRLYESARENHEALVLGARDFKKDDVPTRSRAGNYLSSRLFYLFFGKKIVDTQTGLRAFSVKTGRKLCAVSGDRFDYETSVLIYAVRNKIPIVDVPIMTIYDENCGKHTSHFKTLGDSMRIIAVLFKSVNLFVLSALLSGVIDIGIFHLLISTLNIANVAIKTLISTVTARAISSLFNFTVNYKIVFRQGSSGSILRYYILALCQLGLSYGFTYLCGNVLGFNITVSKAIIDTILGIFSFFLQKRWVYREKERGFFGVGLKTLIYLSRIFSAHYMSEINPSTRPCVYVCRHLNLHGPITTLKWLGFDSHLFVLGVFFEKDSCYRHYMDVTFKTLPSFIKAPLCLMLSRIVPILLKSAKAIPVFRDKQAHKTFKIALEYLSHGQSVIVYPDVEYSAGSGNETHIYDGFLYLGELYKRRVGGELDFVPLFIDEQHRVIRKGESICVNNYNADRQWASAYIVNSINRTV